MDQWTFGLTMMIVATTATFLTLWLLGVIIGVLKKLFPLLPEEPGGGKKS